MKISKPDIAQLLTTYLNVTNKSNIITDKRDLDEIELNFSDSSININDGLSGSIMFFINLFEHTNNHLYLNQAKNKADIILKNLDTVFNENYSFCYGKMGAVFALTALYKKTSNKVYLSEALKIAKKCNVHFLGSLYTNDSLYSGRAGTVMVLLQIYQISCEEWILAYIDQFVDKILTNLYYGPTGLRSEMPRNTDNIQGLCCLASGSAGIAYMFLELGKYFNNKAFYNTAERLLDYINHCWNAKLENWPNFQKKAKNAHDFRAFKEELLLNGASFFLQPSDDTTFNNGTAGIGLVYLRAFEILGKDNYKIEIDKAVKKIKSKYTVINDDELVNNLKELFSYLPFVIELNKSIGDNGFREWLLEGINTHIKRLEYQNEFSVKKEGYHFINKLIASENLSPSFFDQSSAIMASGVEVIAPGVDTAKYKTLFIQDFQLRKTFLKSIFPYTIFVLENKYPQIFDHYISDRALPAINLKTDFIDIFGSTLKDLKDPMLDEAFSIELTKLKISDKIESNALVHFQKTLYQQQLTDIFNLDDPDFEQQKLLFSKDTSVIETQYNWDKVWMLQNLEKEELKKEFDDFCKQEQHLLLLSPNSNISTSQIAVYEDSFIVDSFIEPTTIKVIKDNLMDFCKKQDKEFFSSFLGDDIVLNDAFFKSMDEKILKSICAYMNIGILRPAI